MRLRCETLAAICVQDESRETEKYQGTRFEVVAEMIERPAILIEEFVEAALSAGLIPASIDVVHELQDAPHSPHSLPREKCAVYVFSLSERYGQGCPAGPNRVLKVGKVGPKSNARFQSQHYNPGSAPSTLGATLHRSVILWPYLGITELDLEGVGRWIKRHTDRDHFYIDASEQVVLADLERYVRGRTAPVFEGG